MKKQILTQLWHTLSNPDMDQMSDRLIERIGLHFLRAQLMVQLKHRFIAALEKAIKNDA